MFRVELIPFLFPLPLRLDLLLLVSVVVLPRNV